MNDHIEETPEMAKVRKAKAALKNSQANIAEIVRANDDMSSSMKSAADDLDRLAKTVGEGIHLNGYFSSILNSHPEKTSEPLQKLLVALAIKLRAKAV